MPRSLPARPNLEWLRKTARDELASLRATRPQAKLAEAQLAVARDHGFSSWRALKSHVERLASVPPAPALDPETIVAAFLERVGTGRLDDVRAMLDAAPALVNAVGPHPFWGGRPQALHVAIEGKRHAIVDLLLARGADVNGANENYDLWSPLMLAIDRRRPELQRVLLDRGARRGLLESLMLGDDARVAALLDAEGLPASAPNRGSILAFARTPFAIDRLLAAGAPADLKDQWGARPIDAMSRLGQAGEPLVRHMVARGIAASPSDYARLGNKEMLERLAEGDPALVSGDSVLMAAVDFKRHDLVAWLLARGASVNARSDAVSRHTALHSAAWNGDLEMVELLIRAGADLHARDAQYNATPLGWAETSIEVSNNQNCADVVEYLRPLAGDSV